MANANITTVTVSNTFDDWRVATNSLITDRNILRNTSYVKDESDFTVANGAVSIARTTGGTLLTLSTASAAGADLLVGGRTTTTNLTVSRNTTTANMSVTARADVDTLYVSNLFVTTAVSAPSASNSSTYFLRDNATSVGDGTFAIKQGSANGNAAITYFSSPGNWQISSNTRIAVTNGYSMIITAANVVDLVTSTSANTPASANAAKTAYDKGVTAHNSANTSANTVRVSANSFATLSAQQVNFVNTATVQVSVVAGTGVAAGNANIAFTVVGGTAGAQGAQGSVGAQGTVGSQGSIGSQGLVGTQGSVGAQGVQGSIGSQGIIGSQGAIGSQGLVGTQGSVGAQGVQGAGYIGIPQNSQGSTYTLVVGDAGKHISTGSQVNIPNGVFSTGDAVSIYNNSASAINIANNTSTVFRLAGTASVGTRSLAQYGLATVLCVAANTFVASGAGLT